MHPRQQARQPYFEQQQTYNPQLSPSQAHMQPSYQPLPANRYMQEAQPRFRAHYPPRFYPYDWEDAHM